MATWTMYGAYTMAVELQMSTSRRERRLASSLFGRQALLLWLAPTLSSRHGCDERSRPSRQSHFASESDDVSLCLIAVSDTNVSLVPAA